jgi:hypothetical protein
MANIGFPVSLRGYFLEDFNFTFLLNSAIVAADVGKAVSLDGTTANTVKLAADNDRIIGRLETFEDREQEGIKVGAVSLKFLQRLPVKTGLTGAEAVVVGSTVVGAGSGEVKARVVSTVATPDLNDNFVAEIDGTYAIVVKV